MLSKQHIITIRDASEKLAGSKRRAFQAQVTIDYLKSKPRAYSGDDEHRFWSS
jgi:hypothetical protein